MREPTQLLRDGRVDPAHAMTEEVAPQRRGSIEQTTSPIIDQIVLVGRHDHERIVGEVFLHLREGMPEVL